MNLSPKQLVDLRTKLVHWYGTDVALRHEGASGADAILAEVIRAPAPAVEMFRETLRHASLHLVDEALTPLCVSASENYPAHPLGWSHFPAPQGLIVWNGEPATTLTASRGEKQAIVAVSWQITLGRFAESPDVLEPVGVVIKPFEDRDGGTYPEPNAEQLHATARRIYRRLVPLNIVWQPFERAALHPDEWATETWAAPCFRVLMATLALMAQTVTTSERRRHGAEARRATRAGVEDPGVTVVRLCQRRDSSSGRGGAVEWSSRWVVSGHWRNQWYPSEKTHRPVWIAPHIKGPDDRPIKVREKVVLFDRLPETAA